MIEHHGLAWFKTSYSQGMNNCVEAAWFKSSYSQGQNSCVETAAAPAGTIYLRDSKLGDSSPILAFSPDEWAAFLAGVKHGEFDR
jgi:hypothetical protein